MRCPKCGFHSFDYLDSCKKCGSDLTELRLRFKFQGYVAPAAAAASPEPTEDVPELPAMAEVESEAIDFGFDVLEEPPTPELATFERASSGPGAGFDDLVDDPSAIDLAADSGLTLEQPFGGDEENVPDDDLPKLDKRFDF